MRQEIINLNTKILSRLQVVRHGTGWGVAERIGKRRYEVTKTFAKRSEARQYLVDFAEWIARMGEEYDAREH